MCQYQSRAEAQAPERYPVITGAAVKTCLFLCISQSWRPHKCSCILVTRHAMASLNSSDPLFSPEAYGLPVPICGLRSMFKFTARLFQKP